MLTWKRRLRLNMRRRLEVYFDLKKSDDRTDDFRLALLFTATKDN